MFIATWLFDKLGYMPKISVQVGVVKEVQQPTEKTSVEKKPTVKKATTRKPAVKKVK